MYPFYYLRFLWGHVGNHRSILLMILNSYSQRTKKLKTVSPNSECSCHRYRTHKMLQSLTSSVLCSFYHIMLPTRSLGVVHAYTVRSPVWSCLPPPLTYHHSETDLREFQVNKSMKAFPKVMPVPNSFDFSFSIGRLEWALLRTKMTRDCLCPAPW